MATSYEIITEQIIKKLNEGKIPWVKPWATDGKHCDGMNQMFPAYSYSTGKRYDLMNQFLLDFQPGEYATFDQIKKAGGRVLKGAKSQVVAGWIVEEKKTKIIDKTTGEPVTDENGDPKIKRKKTFSLRFYRVFNILTQAEGIEPKHNWTEDKLPDNELEPAEAAEAIISRYINSANAPKFETVKNSDRAFFRPSEDLVSVPHISQYKDIAEYYSTVFHELTHSTGIASRCNRKEMTSKTAAFGNKDYSKEELVAEIGSCFLNSHAGLTSENSFRNSVGYIQGWLKALKDDPKMIVFASSQAEKATEYILNA